MKYTFHIVAAYTEEIPVKGEYCDLKTISATKYIEATNMLDALNIFMLSMSIGDHNIWPYVETPTELSIRRLPCKLSQEPST